MVQSLDGVHKSARAQLARCCTINRQQLCAATGQGRSARTALIGPPRPPRNAATAFPTTAIRGKCEGSGKANSHFAGQSRHSEALAVVSWQAGRQGNHCTPAPPVLPIRGWLLPERPRRHWRPGPEPQCLQCQVGFQTMDRNRP